MDEPTILAIVVASALLLLLLLLLILQTRPVSRVWLPWVPKGLRDSTESYFDPRPGHHPNIPNPDEIKVDADASIQEERAATVLRHLFSIAHGLRDFEHYLIRFTIVFAIVAVAALLVIAVVAAQ